MPNIRRNQGMRRKAWRILELPHLGHLLLSILVITSRVTVLIRTQKAPTSFPSSLGPVGAGCAGVVAIGGQARSQQLNFSRDSLAAGFTVLVAAIASKIEQSISIAIDCSAIIALKRSSLCQLDPMSNSARSNKIAHRTGGSLEFLFVGINLQGRVDAIQRAIGSFDLFIKPDALLRLMRKGAR